MRPDRAAFALPLLLALAGCSDSGGAEEPEPTTGTIRGFVLDEALRGLAGANVTVAGSRLVTDDAGGFVAANVTPGSYAVAAEAPKYLARQASVDVVAGNTTEVRLVLPVNASALAFHQTYTFKGFTQLHGGARAPALAECTCTFTVPIDGNWRTVVAEAQWTDATPSPTPTEYAWNITAGATSVGGSGPSPILGRVASEQFAPGLAQVDVTVQPHSTGVFANQQFEVVVTVWYGEPAPEGFRSLAP